jgi:primase-polymerase (primpol)-like protein
VSFALGDGWSGLDLDDYTSHPVWGPRLRAVGAYAERSPGGTGIKLIGRAARVGAQLDFARGEPEITRWERGRFFCVTGQSSGGDPTADLSAFLAAYVPVPDEPPPSPRDGYRDAAYLSDDDLLLHMVGSDSGLKILALWRGSLRAYGDDHSRADQALCCYLAFWTNYDAARIDRLFRQSGLMRPKWNADSYRRATLSKALRKAEQ